MANSQVIDKLNEILQHEWTGVAQYAQAGFMVTGLWREVYSKMFFESAEESFGHAQKVGEKIAALGGVPTVERKPIRQSRDVKEMLEHGLEFEQAAVKLYNEAIALSEDDRALTVFLEDILVEEQEGVDHITQLLRDHNAHEQQDAASKTG